MNDAEYQKMFVFSLKQEGVRFTVNSKKLIFHELWKSISPNQGWQRFETGLHEIKSFFADYRILICFKKKLTGAVNRFDSDWNKFV